jgi:hypothetical protein
MKWILLNCHNLGLDNGFLTMIPKMWVTKWKNRHINSSKLKISYVTDNINKIKKNKMGNKIFTIHISKGFSIQKKK